MNIYKYAAKTASGKVYLVEEQQTKKGSDWYIYRENQQLRINCLITLQPIVYGLAKMWAKGKPLPEDYATDKAFLVLTSNFLGRMILYSNNIDPNKAKARFVTSEVVEFKPME